MKTVTISLDNKLYDVTYDDTIATVEEMEQAAKNIGYPVSTVTYVGESLTADGGADRGVSEGETVILDGSSSHGPNDISSYQWTQDSGIPVTIKDADTAQASFVAPDVSEDVSVSFRLTVKDSTGQTAMDTIAIVIRDSGGSVYTHTNLTPDEAKAMMDANPDLIIIDVREESEFCGTYGHIPGSLNYPWNSGVLQDRYEELAKDAEIMIVCRSGNRSDLAASFLDSKGFSAVYDIGGIQSWEWDTLTCDGQYTLSATVNADQSVSLNWEQYWGSDFESYTILRNTFPDAEYPDDGHLWQGENTGMSSYADESPLMGSSYYRLCIIKTDGTSLCSNDVQITLIAPLRLSLSPAEMSGYAPLRVSFAAEASGGVPPYTYAWAFNDGTTGIGGSPAHIYADPGTYTPTLTVTDAEGETITQSALITALEFDQLPVANAGESQVADEGTEVRLDGSGSYDSGGDSLTYLWEQVSGTPATLSDPSVLQPVFIAPDIVSEGESLTFRLTVRDPAGQESSDTVIINVTGMNLPPMANAGANQTVSEGDTVTLDGSSSYDSDGMIMAYIWKQISGPDVSLSDPSDPRPFFVAPNMDSAGDALIFRLTVTDDTGLQTANTTTVSVIQSSVPPVAEAGPDQTLEEGVMAALDGSASEDADGDIRQYLWEQISGASVTLSDAGNDQVTFLSPKFEEGNAYLEFRLTVTDNDGFQNTDTLVVHVLPRSIGHMASNDLWIRAVIQTVEKGAVDAVWKKGGEAKTTRGDTVIWGHFYASPDDVSWGSQNNPDLFVKIWYDVSGRLDVSYFHVSVPDITVYSDYLTDVSDVQSGITSMTTRYIRQYYENGQIYSEEKDEDGNALANDMAKGDPQGYSATDELIIGAIINTDEKGAIDAVWEQGGQDMTQRGDQVVWGHFYAHPSDVTWGQQDNPDLFVKIWSDVSGRIDVNYFHVSVPDIEVYSDFPADSLFDKAGTTTLDNRYIRHNFN